MHTSIFRLLIWKIKDFLINSKYIFKTIKIADWRYSERQMQYLLLCVPNSVLIYSINWNNPLKGFIPKLCRYSRENNFILQNSVLLIPIFFSHLHIYKANKIQAEQRWYCCNRNTVQYPSVDAFCLTLHLHSSKYTRYLVTFSA